MQSLQNLTHLKYLYNTWNWYWDKDMLAMDMLDMGMVDRGMVDVDNDEDNDPPM